MAAARRAAVKIAFLSGAGCLFAAGSARDVAAAGGERFENWVEVLDDFIFAANHLAVAAIKSPDAATGADVTIVNTLRAEFFGTANVVNVIGIATVDDDVVLFKLGDEILKSCVDNSRGDHQPDGARLREFFHKIVERVGGGCTFAGELLDGFRAAIVDDAGVAIANQAAHHVGTHPPQTDHSELHSVCS